MCISLIVHSTLLVTSKNSSIARSGASGEVSLSLGSPAFDSTGRFADFLREGFLILPLACNKACNKVETQ